MYYGFLLLASFAMVLVLFTSVAGIVIWSLKHFVGPADNSVALAEKRRRHNHRVDQWNPDHPLFSKRAGQ
jgi:hypothetical protein